MSDAVSSTMKATIRATLATIAREEGIDVVFAAESGSRAWGFHSPDSDYDVRFVYVRPRAWHYRLGEKRDVIERPIDAALDISGWELSKALTLAVRSNATIAEWLQSPIVYDAHPRKAAALRAFCAQALDRKAVTWHYLSLLQRQQKLAVAPDGGLKLKRFFYMVRPALALRWMRLNDPAMPPMAVSALLPGCALPEDVTASLFALVARKQAVREAAVMSSPAPGLVDLVNEEARLAESWLQSARSAPDPALWAQASDLHMRLSDPAFTDHWTGAG